MNPHGLCTCSPSARPCPACVGYTGVTYSAHAGVPGPKATTPRAPRRRLKAKTKAEVLVILGAWITTHQRFPLRRDWRRPHPERPPLSTFTIYRRWGAMVAFYQDCVAAGYGTRQMLLEARVLSGQNLKVRTRGANVYEVIHNV